MKKIILITLIILIQFFISDLFGEDEEAKLTGFSNKIKYRDNRRKNKDFIDIDSEKMTESYKKILDNITQGVPFDEELLYTDWGATHSQATAGELKVFRDLITFARNPKLLLPAFLVRNVG